MNNVDTKLKEIADSITEYLYNPETEKIMGLYTGDVGMLMFMAYYSRYSDDDKYRKIADKLLDDCCERVCSGVYYTPFCGGLSGMLYEFGNLNRLGFIDVDITEVHESYSFLLRKHLKDYAEKGQFDFMHNATGIAIYLLHYGNSLDLESVADYVKLLDHTAEHENGTAKWKFSMNLENENIYNIAMSHGMSSIAIFLSQCVEKNIEPQISGKLLSGVINYIMRQEIDAEKYGSCFPSTSLESGEPAKSRMGWCYGDLGIAITLWRAGIALDNDQWKAKALQVMEFAAGRRDLKSNSVIDACICHGTAGIAQIFRRMYYNTGDEKFLSASEYWIDETLKMAKWQDSKAAGFKYWTGEEHNWQDSFDFLEGISGIGLSLISSCGDESLSSWDEILLLS